MDQESCEFLSSARDKESAIERQKESESARAGARERIEKAKDWWEQGERASCVFVFPLYVGDRSK